MVKMVTVSVTGSRRIPVVNSAAKSHSCLYQVIITVKVQCATQRNHLFLIFGCKLLQYCCIVLYNTVILCRKRQILSQYTLHLILWRRNGYLDSMVLTSIMFVEISNIHGQPCAGVQRHQLCAGVQRQWLYWIG